MADDWRVSRAAADVGAATAYITDTPPDQLLRITHAVDPDGRYLAAAVPAGQPARRTVPGRAGRRVAVRQRRPLGDSWGAAGPAPVQEWLTAPASRGPHHLRRGLRWTVDLADIRLEGDPEPARSRSSLRYTARRPRLRETVVQLGDVPPPGHRAPARGGTSGVRGGLHGRADLFSGSSDLGHRCPRASLTVQAIAANGADPGDWRLDDVTAWRPARPSAPPGQRAADARAPTRAGCWSPTPKNDTSIIRLTTADVPRVAAAGPSPTARWPEGEGGTGLVRGASALRVSGRRCARPAGPVSLPLVGTDGGLSDLGSALRECGDQVERRDRSPTAGRPRHARLGPARRRGRRRPAWTHRRSEAEEHDKPRTDRSPMGGGFLFDGPGPAWRLAFLGLAAWRLVQLRWRAYEVAALRVVGVRRRVAAPGPS